MSETLRFLGGAGTVFTGLAALAWGIASKTEDLMRDDVKEGFASWLKRTSFDKPFRDWNYSFTYLYDVVFGIESYPDRISFPTSIMSRSFPQCA
jgi:hypothetical protein